MFSANRVQLEGDVKETPHPTPLLDRGVAGPSNCSSSIFAFKVIGNSMYLY